MMYAKINANGIVEQVIVADADVIAAYEGTWVETTEANYAGIGHGFNPVSLKFASQPFQNSTWNAQTRVWETPYTIAAAPEIAPSILADGVDALLISVHGPADALVTVNINDEPLQLQTDSVGYASFELTSDTPGLITITGVGDLAGFNLEVMAI